MDNTTRSNMENHPNPTNPSSFECSGNLPSDDVHEQEEPSANVLLGRVAGRLREWSSNNAAASGTTSGSAKRRGASGADGAGGGDYDEDDIDGNFEHRAARARPRPNGSSPAKVAGGGSSTTGGTGIGRLLLQSPSAAAAPAPAPTSRPTCAGMVYEEDEGGAPAPGSDGGLSAVGHVVVEHQHRTVTFRCQVQVHDERGVAEEFEAKVELKVCTRSRPTAGGRNEKSTFSIRRVVGAENQWEYMYRSLIVREIGVLSHEPNPDDPDPTVIFLSSSEAVKHKLFVFGPTSDGWEAKKCFIPPLEALLESGTQELKGGDAAALVLDYLRQSAGGAEGEVADDDEVCPPLDDDADDAQSGKETADVANADERAVGPPGGDGGEMLQQAGGGAGNGTVRVAFTLADGEVRVEHLILDQTFDKIREDLFPPSSDRGYVKFLFNGKDIGVDHTPESLGMHEMEGEDLEVTVVTEQGGG